MNAVSGPWPDWRYLLAVAAGLAVAYIALLLAAIARRALAARRADHAEFEAMVARAKAAHPKAPAPGDAAKLPPSRPVHPPPAPGSPQENLGTCVITCHFHDTGIVVILDHTRKRRIVTRPSGEEPASDDVFLARLEHELWGHPCPDCGASPDQPCGPGCPRLAGDPDGR